MKIVMNTGGLVATNAFLIADEATGEAVLFDAPDHTAGPLLDAAGENGWRLVGLWLTHGHWDHLADHAAVRERFPEAGLLIHPLDEPQLRRPGSSLMQLPFTIPPGEPTGLLNDGDRLKIGGIDVEVIHTPGHAPGHVCFHLPAEETLVGGDLIIGGAVGRTDLPGSDPAALADSVRRTMRLPDATRLLPGHGEPSTLGDERRANPYVRHLLR